jgi:hypothetical protein
LLTIVQRLGGMIRARTLYELKDGTQVNAIAAQHHDRSSASRRTSGRHGLR